MCLSVTTVSTLPLTFKEKQAFQNIENRGLFDVDLWIVKGCFGRELWQYLLTLKAVSSLQNSSKRQSVASGEVNSFRLKLTENRS